MQILFSSPNRLITRPSHGPLFCSGQKKLEERQHDNGWEKQPWYKRFRKRQLLNALSVTMFIVPVGGFVLPNPSVSKAEKAAFIQSHSSNTEQWEYEARARQIRCVKERGLLGVSWALGLFMIQAGILLHSQKSFDKKRAAYHELGHLLALLRENSKFYPCEVTIQPQGERGGHVGFSLKSHTHPGERYTPEQDWYEIRMIGGAGEAMEQLVGIDLFGEEGDRNRVWQVMKKMFLQHPEQWRSLLADYWSTGKEIRDYLMQFDRKTVDALAERLAQDITWDNQKIWEIVREFGLREMAQNKNRGEVPRLSEDLKQA